MLREQTMSLIPSPDTTGKTASRNLGGTNRKQASGRTTTAKLTKLCSAGTTFYFNHIHTRPTQDIHFFAFSHSHKMAPATVRPPLCCPLG